MNFKILDCTLRDGGYYTNWDFDKKLVEDYCTTINELPIEYVEVGYRSLPLEGYLGEYFYCPIYLLENLKSLMPDKKLAIILNEKDVRVEDISEILSPCVGLISMVRIAVAPENIERAVSLALEIKKFNFEVAFNVMYLSKWKSYDNIYEVIETAEGHIDYFYMVDSFGGILPEELKEIISTVKSHISVPLGFHGHNNLELALANTIVALEMGVEIVDATITGMGRGAGNLKTELLLAYLNGVKQLDLQYHKLSQVVANFEELRKGYQWGTNLPYMFSGAFSLPQKQVMEWVGMNRYPLSSILNALSNQKSEVNDNHKLPVIKPNKNFDSAVILGGGLSSKKHIKAVQSFISKYPNTCLIHAGASNLEYYNQLNLQQYFAFSGSDALKLSKNIESLDLKDKAFVYPPYPRAMGTIIPEELKNRAIELANIQFTDVSQDSPLVIALQTALELNIKKLYLIGFDGYDININQTQFVIAQENQQVIDDFIGSTDVEVLSLTPTRYKNLKINSIYGFIE